MKALLTSTLLLLLALPLTASEPVKDTAGFRQALATAKPGSVIKLAPGTYAAGHYFSNVNGADGQPVTIGAADPARPPVLDAANGGLQFSACSHLHLRDIIITNAGNNALNIDDGGQFEKPSRHILLQNLQIYGTSPDGNRDGIKLSGVTDFVIRGCTIAGWGTGGGSGIDMVGCHRGLITNNKLSHTDSVGSTGIQAKGDTSEVVIRRNHFQNAGGRAINIGGSTGLQFFRPPLKQGREHSEASQIVVEGNVFVGSTAPIAFVGVDGATVRFNTFYKPLKWVVRILQETREPGFVPSRRGQFTDNIVVFDSQHWAEGGLNIGDATAPETFTFARNWWYCADNPERSRPRLPVEESGGVHGQSPQFGDPEKNGFRLMPNSPAKSVGAHALPEQR